MTVNKIYISGPLMAAKNLDSVKELYNFVAEICDNEGLNPYLPHNNTDPIKDSHISDAEVFKKDYHEILDSTLVISYIGEPSHGVGAELSICIMQNIPVITINQINQKVSRFLKGMLKTSENVCSIEYSDKSELRQKLINCLTLFINNQNRKDRPQQLSYIKQ